MTAPPDSSTPPQTTAEGESPKGSRKLGEEIVVTGSRIRRKELSSPAPVAVIGREQIQSSGRITVGDFLQAIPEQGNALNTTFNNGGNGATEISLRNLGSQRTLVLVDGKRFISGTPGGGNLTDPGADLNSIPTAAIERIEILKDGASALYGSDAIGGVVNIITRKHFNSVEASATQSLTQHGDASVTDLNVIGGAASDDGGFSLGVGYFKQDSLLASKRDWARFAQGFDYAAQQESPAGSLTTPSGSAQLDPSTCPTALCKALAAAYGPGQKTFIPATSAGGADFPLVSGWRAFNPDLDTYNFQAVNFLVTPSDRFSLYGNGDYKLGGGARAYFHSTLVNRQSSTQLAPVPIVANGAPFLTQLSAANEFNPFGVDVPRVRRRLIESGGRQQSFDVDTVQLIAGIDGTLSSDFGPLGSWGYDVSFNFARNNTAVTTSGSLNTQLVAQAFGPSAGGACLKDATDPTSTIPGCFAVNPFGLPTGNTMSAAQVNSLGGFTGINHGGNQMAMLEVNLNGELPVTLMADRPLGLALGYAYRSEYGFFTFNPIAVAGNDSDFSGTNAAGRYHVNEGYAELSVPVISGMNYVEALELQGAVRYSNYNTFGGTTTYKFGARYTPVRDVTFRGTYSTGFRAPGITSLFGGSTPNAEAATDPCANVNAAAQPALAAQCGAGLKRGGGGAVAVNNGDDSNQINSTSGSNPRLQPEKADIYTAGIVLEPRSLLRNFTVTADYFHVKVNQNITSITTPVILAGCYPGASGTVNQGFCDLIQRDATGAIIDVTDVLQNAGTETIQGLDLAIRYGLPTSVGRFNFSADSSILFQHDQVLADGTVIKGLNTYDLFVNPTAKFNLGVGYNVGGFLAAVRGRFVTGFHECADPDGASGGSGLCYKNNLQPDGTPFPVHNIPFYDVYDLHLSYALRLGTGTTTVSGGVRNVLNKDPPRVYNTVAQTNSDPSTYDYLGRNFYVQLAHRF